MAFWIALIIVVALTIGLVIIEKQRDKEIKEMTVEKFKEKCEELAKEGNATKLDKFIKTHIVTVLKNYQELTPFFKEMAEKYKQEGKQ